MKNLSFCAPDRRSVADWNWACVNFLEYCYHNKGWVALLTLGTDCVIMMDSELGDRARGVKNLAAHSTPIIVNEGANLQDISSSMLFLYVRGEPMKDMYEGSTLFYADGMQLA